MNNEPANQRAQDKLYESFMRCNVSDTGKHLFVLRAGEKWVQHLECKYCWVHYDRTLHSPPEGYKPSE